MMIFQDFANVLQGSHWSQHLRTERSVLIDLLPLFSSQLSFFVQKFLW
jgi:hypothetical protein